MEKDNYKKEVSVAVTMLLCLWFKLDAVIEYGTVNISCFSIASCGLLSVVILSMLIWMLLTNHKKLWTIVKEIFKSEMFDTISWIAFLMPIISIEKYSLFFACASWVFGDIVLIVALLMDRKQKLIQNQITSNKKTIFYIKTKVEVIYLPRPQFYFVDYIQIRQLQLLFHLNYLQFLSFYVQKTFVMEYSNKKIQQTHTTTSKIV